ncbi:hypothetical protein [Legionella parisiensis]|uniref:Substrate of the Dot/Icm secretion system n=1 Tax=Legionella parisiensis TaxID=45071 RepID=A0A1E5JMR0_9GAMM|nr:hypothetical protein [Legionella parisiensis]KTD42282.1 substrate of the Dot/Icm secretion system [Legionella parisiensis]OEH45835.1 hypothetical protein lpari_03154 [Legionella parisiensis]STX72351.1 Dot/Icm secretion system substrate [Legionella parisiensis]
MPSDIERLTKLRDKQRKQYEEAQELAEKTLLKAMGTPPKIEDYESAMNAFKKANGLAYQTYQRTQQINNAKSDDAFKEYDKTCEENNAKSRAAGERSAKGEITHEEYLKIKEECDKANEEAYEKAVKIKEANDNASKEAYEQYKAIFEKNGKEMDIAKKHYEKQNPSPPPLTVTAKSENVNAVASAFKEHFKNDEWYKNHEPQIEGNKTTLTFKSDEDALNFAKKLASENQNFILIDKETNKVLAYSKDGKLFRGDKELTDGPLRPSKEEIEKLPTLDTFQKSQTPPPTSTEDSPLLTSPHSSNPGENIPEIPTLKQPIEESSSEELEKQKGLTS